MSKLIDALKRAEQLRKAAAQSPPESATPAAPAAASAEAQAQSMQQWVSQKKAAEDRLGEMEAAGRDNQRELEEISRAAAEIQAQTSAANARAGQLEQNHAALRQTITAETTRLSGLERELEAARLEQARLEAATREAEDSAAAVREKLATTRQQLDARNAALESAKSASQAALAGLFELDQTLAKSGPELQAMESALRTVQQEHQARQNTLAQRRDDLARHSAAVAQTRAELADLQVTLSTTEKEQGEAQRTLDAARAEQAALEQSLRELHVKRAKSAELAAETRRIEAGISASLRQLREREEAERAQAVEALQQAEAANDSAIAEQQRLDEQLDPARQAMMARDDGATLPASGSRKGWWALAVVAAALGGFWIGGKRTVDAPTPAPVVKSAPPAVIVRPSTPIASGEPMQLKLDAELRAAPATR